MKKIIILLLVVMLLPGTAFAQADYRLQVYEYNGVRIEYPQFLQGDDVNPLILNIVASLISFDLDEAQLNDESREWEYYPDGAKVLGTKDYRCEVTFANESIVSFVLWGYQSNVFSMHETKDVFAYNIDRYTLQNIRLQDAFYTDQYLDQLHRIFFSKAALSDTPAISYNSDMSRAGNQQFFNDMMNYLIELDESPFNVSYPRFFFLKPEGVVVGLAVSHSYGEYFDAALPLEDVKPYMNPYVLDAMTK